MTDKATFLFELGTEELPPGSLLKLRDALRDHFVAQLKQASLEHGQVECFAAPRRLALKISALDLRQPDREVEKRGPALQAAYNQDGTPSKAAEGFARSCDTSVAELSTLKTDKGEWLMFRQSVTGATAASLIPDMLRSSLAALPIAKRMRWGSSDTEFVRPVHWCVLLLDDTIIDAEILGVNSGRSTRGHRFHHPQEIVLQQAADYPAALEQNGHVLADFEQRRQAIADQARTTAASLGGEVLMAPDLLDEITALVEWPRAISGGFDNRYLQLPSEVLITTMQINQKYFPVVDDSGKLLASFITFSNIDSTNPDAVRHGNERVIRPRLSDAEFFWQQDRKQSLAERVASLENIVFQKTLGSLADKTRRVEQLATGIAGHLSADTDLVSRAALLARTDLVTEMVGEFPSLQGTMGRYYAQADGEPEAVATAIEQQYYPKQSGGELPSGPTGQILALAEKIDTICGIFSAGLIPSGDRDPYALRRAALGALRIIIEKQLDLSVPELIKQALSALSHDFDRSETTTLVTEFINDRLRGYCLQELDYTADEFDAVAATSPARPLDFIHRLAAVRSFRSLPEADSLTAANKRIRNLLKKSAGDEQGVIEASALKEPLELQLLEASRKASAEVAPLLASGRYTDALKALAQLHAPVDAFFEGIMVMDEDPAVRRNRIGLLAMIEELFLRVADISRLQPATPE